MENDEKGNNWRNELAEIDPDDNSLSIFMYGETKEKAYECAEKLFGARIEEGKDVWKKTIEGLEFFGYTRWPDCGDQIKPKSAINGFFFNMKLNGMEDYRIVGPACDFINFSQGIPHNCKFLVRENEDSFTELSYTTTLERNPGFTNTFFENVANNHKNMKQIFDEIDVNKNGTIDAQELIKLLDLNEYSDKEQAEEYLKEISDKEVNFNRYRNWYLKRKDFNDVFYTFQSKVNNLEEAKKFSSVFKTCEDEVNKMSEEEKKKQFNSRFEIKPSSSFEPGICLAFSMQAGDKATAMIDSLADFAKKEEIFLALSIKAKDEDAAVILKTTLEMLKSMAFSVLPGEIKNKINIRFVIQGKSVIIYIMAKKDENFQKIKTLLSAFDLSNLHMNSKFEFGFSTGISPADLLTDNFEELVEKVAQIRLNVSSKIKFSIIAKFFWKFINEMTKAEGSHMSMMPKMFVAFMSFLRMIPTVNSTIELHEEDAIAYLKDLGEIFPEMEYGKLKEMVDGDLLPKLRGMFDQMKSMFGEQAEGFKSAIEAIDFREIGATLNIKPLSFIVQSFITIDNMDDVVEKFFN